MKVLKLIFILACLPLFVVAQENEKQKKYESISKRKLKLDRSVPELLKQAQGLMGKNNAKALDKVEEALAISITEENSFDEAKCYLLLGKINQSIEEWDLAINSYRSALAILESGYNETTEYLEALTGLADSYKRLEDYPQSISNLDQKLIYSNSPIDKANTYLDRADVEIRAGNYSNASQDLDDADQIILGENLRLEQSRSQALRANLLAKQDNVDEAEDYLQQIEFFDDFDLDSVQTGNEEIESSINESKQELINAYGRQNRVDDEIQLRNQSIAENRDRGKTEEVSKEKVALSKTLIDIGNTSQAIKELEDAAELATNNSNPQERASAYEALGDAYYKAGRVEESLDAFRNYRESIKDLEQLQNQKQQEKVGILKKQQDIFSLSRELALDVSRYNLKENQLFVQRLIIYGLMTLLFGAFVSGLFIIRNSRKTKRISELLALKSLRAQMNPHFIFNALNSVNQFIAVNDERAANKFLSDFSKLMRLVLDNSQQDFITLAEEKEIITLYLKLEHNRFRDKFDYTIDIEEEIPLESLNIPPMLVQPYLENAIWHGLRYKEEKGELNVQIKKDREIICILISDNGIGRKKSMELKTSNQKSHKSTGLKNTQERVGIINNVYKKGYKVIVEDLDEDHGTVVRIELPKNGKL